jgi:hypothetical protein
VPRAKNKAGIYIDAGRVTDEEAEKEIARLEKVLGLSEEQSLTDTR